MGCHDFFFASRCGPLECGGSPPLSCVGLAPRIGDRADTRVRPYDHRPHAGASPRDEKRRLYAPRQGKPAALQRTRGSPPHSRGCAFSACARGLSAVEVNTP
ncbi:MAG: hypothetical protein FWH21_05525 [Kiritimatiellaeota bacterium]|nr:hypothetical protein [Kiritimatiellota bacterium]